MPSLHSRQGVVVQSTSNFYAVTPSTRRAFSVESTSASSMNSNSRSSGSSELAADELHDFKDRLRRLGPGRVKLTLDEGKGMASLVLDNNERRNGETEFLIRRL